MTVAALEAERAVLGSVLIAPEAIFTALEQVKATDFEHPAHRVVFETMVDLAREKKPIDTLALVTALHAAGATHIAPEEIVGLPLAVPTAANVGYYARLVRSRARLRHVVAIAKDVVSGATQAADADEYIAYVQGQFNGLTEAQASRVLAALEWTEQARADLEHRAEVDAPPALLTGLSCIDNATALRESSLVLIAGRPSMGKTAFAQDIFTRCAERGHEGLFVSIEMGQRELTHRFIASRSEVDTRDLDRPRGMGDAAWSRVIRSLGRFSELGMNLWIPSRVTAQELWATCRRQHAMRPLKLVVVDYLQLMFGDARSDNREQEVSNISKTCKLIAKELACTVIALSQLNRKVEDRNPPIPQLSDLRDSGSLEQDGDAILFIFRPGYYDDTKDQSETQIIYGKNRNGPRGHGQVRFDVETQRFEDS